MIYKRVYITSTNPLSLESAIPHSPYTRRNFSPIALGILAVLIFSALTFTACPADSPASSAPEVNLADYTYTIKGLTISSSGFTSVFGGTVPTSGNGQVLSLTKDDLSTGKFQRALSAGGTSVSGDPIGTGIAYSQVESTLQGFVNGGNITDSQKTKMLNALKNPGATGVAVFIDSTITVFGIMRE
jgi:hypothetical protein